jgi:large subunit ribosomal protein L3
MQALLGKKLRMTQLWNDKGEVVPVTVLKAGPCPVMQVKTKQTKDGYTAVQIAYDPIPQRQGKDGKPGTPRSNGPTIGHAKKANQVPHRLLREVRMDDGAKLPEVGSVLKVEAIFKDVKVVDVSGTSKGHGFAGCVKRHHFAGGFATHGSKNWREPGAIAFNQSPGRVMAGKRMPGQFGNVHRTVRNLEVVKIEPEHDLLYVKGGVPGPTGGYLYIEKAKAARVAKGPAGAPSKKKKAAAAAAK